MLPVASQPVLSRHPEYDLFSNQKAQVSDVPRAAQLSPPPELLKEPSVKSFTKTVAAALLISLIVWGATTSVQLWRDSSVHCLAWASFVPNKMAAARKDLDRFVPRMANAATSNLLVIARMDDVSIRDPTTNELALLRTTYSGIYSQMFREGLLYDGEFPCEGTKVTIRNVSNRSIHSLRIKFSDFEGYQHVALSSNLRKSEVDLFMNDVNVDSIRRLRAYFYPEPLGPGQEIHVTLYAENAGRCQVDVSGQLDSRKAARIERISYDDWTRGKLA